MSNRKAPERRTTLNSNQENSDLNMAITELHQTIIRLNKVIDRVKPDSQHLSAAMNTKNKKTQNTQPKELCLDNLNIPKVFH